MISIIIPTQNRGADLPPLLESLERSGVLPLLTEVLVVNDGSTDDTQDILFKMQMISPWKELLQVLPLKPHRGRFEARKQGAMKARGRLLFFVDLRILFPEDTGERLETLLQAHHHLMGMPRVDGSKSLFNLYWLRSHEWIYRKHFQDAELGFYLNSENYEEYSKETGVLIVPKNEFLQACEKFGDAVIMADDSILLREMVKTHDLFVTSRFSFDLEPRQTWKEFLWRLIDRGPGFVEYHFFTQRTRFFYASCLTILAASFTLVFSANHFHSLLPGLLLLSTTGCLSVLLITRKPLEVPRLMPLHFLVLCSFSIGIFYGLFHFLVYGRKPGETP
jgi:glycosyltransferase involved in cell wall biosynthesis